MTKYIATILTLLFVVSCDNIDSADNKEFEKSKGDVVLKMLDIFNKSFPGHDVKVNLMDKKLFVAFYDSVGTWGLGSYEHILVEQMVCYLDTSLNSVDSLGVNFNLFTNAEKTHKYLLSKKDMNTIKRNHKNNPKLLSYKRYLTNTMNGKECHDLLSGLDGIAQAEKDNSIRTDFYTFALMYAGAKQNGIADKEKYYRAIMDELYDGFLDPKINTEKNVNPDHLKGLLRILD